VTAISVLFGADEMAEGDREDPPGAAEEEESGEGSSPGEGVDDTPSWLHGGFESEQV